MKKPSPKADESIVSLLGAALLRLKAHNPRISVRSLALHLEVSSSYLSKVFRGERRLPVTMLGRLAKAMQLDHHEVAKIQRSLLREMEDRTLLPSTGIRTIPELEPRVADQYSSMGKPDFWLLERWYYLPLLNLVTTEGFCANPTQIAARLGIKEDLVTNALERLVKANYLRANEAGELERTQLKFRFPTQRSHQSVRSFHQSMIQKALPLLDRPPSEKEFAERLLSGITLAGDPSLLPEAKVVIEEALYKAAELLAGGTCTEVFQVNLQLFKLTR